jgi:hypothetical protein
LLCDAVGSNDSHETAKLVQAARLNDAIPTNPGKEQHRLCRVPALKADDLDVDAFADHFAHQVLLGLVSFKKGTARK